MFNIVLFEPEIPPNTGNIIRLCANTQTQLHLIHPLGFAMDAKNLRRASLDYTDLPPIRHYEHYEDYIKQNSPQSLYAISTKGKHTYTDCTFSRDASFIFGPETRGLPKQLLATFDRDKVLRIPMVANNRSLNLANAVAIIVYEAWRQYHFQII